MATIPSVLQEALDASDFDTLETAWLTCTSEDPAKVEAYLRVIDVLEKRDQTERLETLLELLDEQLVSNSLWDERLQLLRHSGKRYVRTGHVFETVMETVLALYAEREDALQLLLPAVGLDKAKDGTPKLWDKVERLRNLLIYEPGIVVEMEGKGVGRVVDVNLTLQTLKVDLETVQGMSVGFRGAGKLLKVLAPEHILRRKLETPDELKKLDPPSLLRSVLLSYDAPLSGAEVRQVVRGLVPEKSWSSWWANARKHPQVLSTGGSRQRYSWAEDSEAAESALWKAFAKADPRTQIEHLKRAAHQDELLRTRMNEQLSRTGESVRSSDFGLALTIYQALVGVGAKPDWDLHDEIRALKDPASAVLTLSPRALREEAYRMIRRERDDWPAVLERCFLGEEDPRLLRQLTETIQENGQEAYDRLIGRGVAQPRATPAVATWIAEIAAEDQEIRQRLGLRLLKVLLNSLVDEAFRPFRPRLEVLVESGGTLPRLLSDLDAADAEAAQEALEEARGLQGYQRRPLLTALHLRFPQLEREEAEEPLWALSSSLDSKREELRALLREEIPANRKAIEEARAHGDLRENFEYKAARQRHEYLTARATNLNSQLERAKILELDKVDTSEIRVGTHTVMTSTDGERRFMILGPWESAPEKGIVSYESELAQSMLGCRSGDLIEVESKEHRVTEIRQISAEELS